MDFERANKIVETWGKYLELVHSKLTFIFLSEIPESLLPYSKNIIEEAINVIAEKYHKDGNSEAVKTLQNTIGYLSWYTNDEQAIRTAGVNFTNHEFLEKVILKKM